MKPSDVISDPIVMMLFRLRELEDKAIGVWTSEAKAIAHKTARNSATSI